MRQPGKLNAADAFYPLGFYSKTRCFSLLQWKVGIIEGERIDENKRQKHHRKGDVFCCWKAP